MVYITVTSKLCITIFPVSIPSNVDSSIKKPGINALKRKNTPIQRIVDIKKDVKKFSLMVKNPSINEERNIAIAKITKLVM